VTSGTRHDACRPGVLTRSRRVAGVTSGTAEQAAASLLSWCERTDRRWLLVLDDLTDPVHLTGLWPTGPGGRVLVSTHRHDSALTGRSGQPRLTVKRADLARQQRSCSAARNAT
jgi:hypothetical protein